MTASQPDTVLKVEDLKIHFPITAGAILRKQVGTVKAVDGVSFSVARGETVPRGCWPVWALAIG